MIIKTHTGLGDRKTVRSFIAINIPFDTSRAIKQILRAFYKQDRNLVYVPIDQMHITLQFLGDGVSQESLDLIAKKLQPLIRQLPPVVVHTGQLRFGHKSQTIPTVLFLEVEQTEELQNLTKVIHYGMKSLSLPDIRREKDYTRLIYHITLARAKHHVARSFGRQMNGVIKTMSVPILEFKPDKVHLLTSKYTIKGHRYSENYVFPFSSNA
jgi:2'-5' RNA ligase